MGQPEEKPDNNPAPATGHIVCRHTNICKHLQTFLKLCHRRVSGAQMASGDIHLDTVSPASRSYLQLAVQAVTIREDGGIVSALNYIYYL